MQEWLRDYAASLEDDHCGYKLAIIGKPGAGHKGDELLYTHTALSLEARPNFVSPL